jgi:peroxiredoxin
LGTLINSSDSADLGRSGPEKENRVVRRKTGGGVRIKLSMGNLLVIGLIVAVTVFAIVFAVINRSTSDSTTTTTTVVDDTSPVISSINVTDITNSDAIITWDTDRPTRSQLEFGTTSTLGINTSLSEELKLTHRIHLSGLDPNTTYYYKVRSVDADGNEVTSAIYEMVTAELQIDKLSITISEISVSDITDSSATIIWKTDKEATSQVEYGITSDDSLLTKLDEQLSTTHKVDLTGLSNDTTYFFRVKSIDNAGNEVISDNSTKFITLSSKLANSVEGREAPEFTVLDLEGETVALKDFRGKWVMIVFWQANCGACRTEMPHLQSYYVNRENDEPVLLAVSVREKEAFIRVYVESQKLTFTVLMDSVGLVANQYKVKSYPTTFLIDTEGIVKKELRHVFKSPEEIVETLNSIMGSTE